MIGALRRRSARRARARRTVGAGVVELHLGADGTARHLLADAAGLRRLTAALAGATSSDPPAAIAALMAGAVLAGVFAGLPIYVDVCPCGPLQADR